MKVSEVIDSNFIEHGDLDGREITLTIASVAAPGSVTRADKSKIDKPVLYFEKTRKGFVLNKTNMRLIRMLHGNEMDRWVGKDISLRPTTTQMAKGAAQHVGCTILKDLGKMVVVPCIRVKVEFPEEGED
jgi:hypothetical protein